jgi:hypothetical protein
MFRGGSGPVGYRGKARNVDQHGLGCLGVDEVAVDTKACCELMTSLRIGHARL